MEKIIVLKCNTHTQLTMLTKIIPKWIKKKERLIDKSIDIISIEFTNINTPKVIINYII